MAIRRSRPKCHDTRNLNEKLSISCSEEGAGYDARTKGVQSLNYRAWFTGVKIDTTIHIART